MGSVGPEKVVLSINVGESSRPAVTGAMCSNQPSLCRTLTDGYLTVVAWNFTLGAGQADT